MKPSFILFLISSVSYFGSIDTASSGMWNKLFGYGSFDECMIGEMEGKDKSLYGHVYRDCLKKTSKKKSAKEKERDRIRRQEQKQHQYDNTRVTCNLRNKRDISLKIKRGIMGLRFTITNNTSYNISEVIIAGGAKGSVHSNPTMLIRVSQSTEAMFNQIDGMLAGQSGIRIKPYQSLSFDKMEAPTGLHWGVKTVSLVGRRNEISDVCY